MGPTLDETLDVGCRIKRRPAPDLSRHNKTLVRVCSLEAPGVYQPYVHHDCSENQIRSIVGRVAGPVVKPTAEGLKLLRVAARALALTLPSTVANSIHDMPKKYSGNKRKLYERAAEALEISGLYPPDAYCKMFVKSERIDGLAKRNPDPRAIQFRGAKYCVALASFLHPIEHALYITCFASRGVPKTRNVAKGLNSVQRAELLEEKMSYFDSPVVIGIDAARFDKHVSKALLKIEHSVYLFSNNDLEFRFILNGQLVNVVFTSTGIKYVVDGRRMSGDMNTALGNCVLMICMIYALFIVLSEVRKWDCLDDGDDALIIVEAHDAAIVMARLPEVFLGFGMEMKVDAPVTHISKVVFCQSCVVEYAPGRVKFVRDYRAVISKALCGIRHWEDARYRRSVLRAIGTCELILNLAVPVLQSFAWAVLRNVGGVGGDLDYAPEALRLRTNRDLKSLGLKAVDVRPREIPWCARESFGEAFGLDPHDQMRFERNMDRLVFNWEELQHYGEEWLVHEWLPTFSRVEVVQLQE